MFFSTQAVQADVRRDAWMQTINHHCGSFVSTMGDNFEGSIDARRVGGFDCARISQTTRETWRTHREVDRDNPENYFVILQISGRSCLEQSGRAAVMTPGDVTIIDSAQPCRFRFERKNIQLSLHIPHARLANLGVPWADRVATPLPRSSSVIVGTLLRSSFEHVYGSDPLQEQAIADALVGLIVAGWSGSPIASAEAPHPDESARLFRSIQDYVVGHLDSETLTPASIAHAHRISERQVHRIFQNSGLSVCRWIRQSRLDRCAADLRDSAQRHRTITEIAFHWGFNDAAHFSRLFRSEFGQAPSEYRAGALQKHQAATVN